MSKNMETIVKVAAGVILGVLILAGIARMISHNTYVMQKDYCPTVEEDINGDQVTVLKC